MERKERLDLLRKVLAGDDISAMIIPSTDPHFGEYIPDHYKVLEWLSGFTGEAATLVVTQEEAALWVDSRFFIQAAAQLEGSGIEMMKLKVEGTPSIADWLKARLEADDIVAMDEDLFPYSEYMEMMDSLAPLSPALIEDPFDKVWKDRPARLAVQYPRYGHRVQSPGPVLCGGDGGMYNALPASGDAGARDRCGSAQAGRDTEGL